MGKKIFDISALIVIIAGQIISVWLNVSNEQKGIEVDNILTSSIIIVFAIFCISMYFDMQKFKRTLYKEIHSIKTGSNIVTTKMGKGSDDFYSLALEYLNVSNSTIWLTSLNEKDPNVKGSIMRTKYFKEVIPFAKKNKSNVEVRRIVKIPTLEKLEWVKKQIESAKNLENVSFAYIDKDTKILNVQIFDEKKMLLWDPGQDRVSQKHNKFICSENADVVEMFSEYYENIWKELSNNRGGFIIKDRNKSSRAEIEQRLQKIKEYVLEEQK